MNTIKDTLYLKEHYPDIDPYVFYIDIRASGKGFEELFKRSKKLGVKYIRGIPGDIVEDPETKNLILTVENTTNGKLEKYELEMVVLSVGATPRLESDEIKKLLKLSTTGDGFFMGTHPQLSPIDANRWMQKRIERMWDKLERKGIRPERLQLEWCSAAEATRWSTIMHAVEELQKTVTKEEIEKTKRILLEEDKKDRKKSA